MKFIASGRFDAARTLRGVAGIVALSATLIASFASAHASSAPSQAMSDLEDTAARMQYAFFTEDIQALEDVLARLTEYTAPGALEAVRSYQLAYGHWRLAELYAAASERGRHDGASQAADAARVCVDEARNAVASDAQDAEAHAILAVCEALPRGGLRLPKPLSGSCARSRALRTATSLAAKNPRVRFVDALCTRAADEAADLTRWREIVDTFRTTDGARQGKPDWGHAEALLELARRYMRHDDRVAARDAVERALVIAPDYVAAQALLRIVAGSSAQ
jgi:tetratricopeptide (TPR) repeat protein